MSTSISRRALLRAGGTATLAAIIAACADTVDDGTAAAPDGDPTTAAPPTPADALTIIIPTFEVITGPGGRVPMGILGADNRPLLDASPSITIVRAEQLDEDGTVLREAETVVDGEVPLFYGEGLGDRGIYVLETDLPAPGIHDVEVTIDGVGTGTSVFAAIDPEDAQVFAPGQEFPALATPTTDEPGQLETLCTQDPPCSMHELSLDEAMAAGPVVFTVATPQFCQTAVCGPVVSVIEQVRDQVGRDDVSFVHVEVYTDAGVTLTPTVGELGLPTEPWTWVIDGDGIVVDRFDGPVVPSLLAESVLGL